jgi:hypothetical protein
MKLPFTIEQFLKIFEDYNLAVWPMQIVLYILGAGAIFFAVKKLPQSNKIIFLILAVLWIWMGIVYNLIYFTAINRAAYIFGISFIVEGTLFFFTAFSKNTIPFQLRPDLNGITGCLLLVFALVLYPILGNFQGHVYPSSPTFGLPCPTTIFTFALLLWANKRIPIVLLIIPFVWSIIGFSAAFSLGIKEDIGLIISGLLSTFLIAAKNKKYRKALAINQHNS